ncbi:hypothetical protein HK405_010297 [Cladochytrium tenue]|nr:hypothetical protein HK405_010297 [Cladochytrium tenue]
MAQAVGGVADPGVDRDGSNGPAVRVEAMGDAGEGSMGPGCCAAAASTADVTAATSPDRSPSAVDHLVSSELGESAIGSAPVRKASLDGTPEMGDGDGGDKAPPKLDRAPTPPILRAEASPKPLKASSNLISVGFFLVMVFFYFRDHPIMEDLPCPSWLPWCKHPPLPGIPPDLPRGGHEDDLRMGHIKEMMVHAWTGYTEYAWGADDLNPLSKTPLNWYPPGTLLNTAVDSLSTLHIMGLHEEFARAKEYILKRYLGGGDKFFAKLGQKASFFETNIRIVGGLLSAYEFDGDRRLVDAACVVADRLVSAFYWDKGRFNIPLNEVNMTRYNISNAASPLT